MREVFYLLGFSLLIWWFFARRKIPALEASEMLQLPALRHDERPWTKLDELVLNVARHDVLAQWHSDGRKCCSIRLLMMSTRKVGGM